MDDINPFYTDFVGKNTKNNAVKDKFGNLLGNEYDLAKDGAFKGKLIAVLHLYTGEGFDFKLPQEALEEKGFSIVRWEETVPPEKEFKNVLSNSSQLWVISSRERMLNKEYLRIIKNFYNEGHGLFIWGDNEPYFQDANYITENLFNVKMRGDKEGNQVVSLQNEKGKAGIIRNHPITTGIENIFEGVTIATIDSSKELTPLIYGSANNIVTCFYEHNGKRAIIDGGFTRLFINWDTAGTARFVKNAAAWLANVELFDALTPKDKKESNAPETLRPNIDDFDFSEGIKDTVSNKKLKKPNLDDFEF